MKVQPKKHLGQHFLTDKNMCRKIANTYGIHENCARVVEVGAGMGALTEALLERKDLDIQVADVDTESIVFLKENFKTLEGKIHEVDFLKTDIVQFFGGEQFGVVGNFPYNISSQIIFRCLEYRDLIPEIMGMFQREMALRIAEKPGTKQYGIISVLTQAFYDVTYCFTVDEHLFNPPPRVKSGVIRCTRNNRKEMVCREDLFIQVVKMGFNQRRKTLRNSLKQLLSGMDTTAEIFNLRPERLSVDDFIGLTMLIQNHQTTQSTEVE
ncbi:MAG: 16S rRNA (adenine(1518)-N(6)/adenine(1519)-N(6))-dimethyltransferase RsmA [Bacteroidetes bacterium]|nr:16S rRNA (adenine(1518)-N(6)/adenine(1519)-N(6))-dimethyltransferase RsmA [Bacteroidota bacterium]